LAAGHDPARNPRRQGRACAGTPLRAVLEAGTDPAVVGQWIAEVTAARHAAQASLHQLEAAQVGGLAAAPGRRRSAVTDQVLDQPMDWRDTASLGLREAWLVGRGVGGANATIGLRQLVTTLAL
jgi:hypothetical protein